MPDKRGMTTNNEQKKTRIQKQKEGCAIAGFGASYFFELNARWMSVFGTMITSTPVKGEEKAWIAEIKEEISMGKVNH